MSFRPDELAAQEEVERYNRIKNRFSGAGKSIASAAGALGGVGIASRVLPFINEFIPVDMAVKGISKVSPTIGNFLKRGLELGLDPQEGLQFVKENIQKAEPEKKKKGNLIEQYDPELHTYISEKLKRGESLFYAGKKALDHPRFKKAVDKITKDHKASWTDILRSVYGDVFKKREQEMRQQQSPNAPAAQASSQQQGQGEAALMSMLQKLQAMRGGGPKQ